ncbi:MAG: ribosome small subunit-dependent GTPase A [Propionivibrio sp.]|nr:ribosome small subunit-dependent GTPase A [Propionivibrio sp.]MBK7355756.1 ribosome small subunit-dependent GTPase A [Propionivibrio sp.]MBK8400580.1 ribosome small subunit-dependent GTPase A [Propionivibrio sp.]MBK8744347.1 ribosome small subunit-dependent GTPase A [Propionivibrio sp.]MBK8895155.1 ribosome small subunit-dependent GTPase A [Propionivibrio sp.]MBL0206939.1 ribosome small subunit-dependent GTPase A [Propionivibrio sp.]
MHEGTIVAVHGRQYRVELASGGLLLCFPRGKKSELACGDHVQVERSSDTQGVITAIMPRSSLLYRSNEFKQKLIAANVAQIIVVVAADPPFSDELVTRCIVAAESQNVATLIVFNKCDLADRVEPGMMALAPFEKLGYQVLRISARHDVDALRPYLSGRTSVLVGQSGMGKSTLINAFFPDANTPTREISVALRSGKHTTTHATLYRFDAQSSLIDSPGLQEFGLRHLPPSTIEHGFLEFRPLLGQCRFRNCLHNREPGCAVLSAVRQGDIDPRRYAAFRSLVGEAG